MVITRAQSKSPPEDGEIIERSANNATGRRRPGRPRKERTSRPSPPSAKDSPDTKRKKQHTDPNYKKRKAAEAKTAELRYGPKAANSQPQALTPALKAAQTRARKKAEENQAKRAMAKTKAATAAARKSTAQKATAVTSTAAPASAKAAAKPAPKTTAAKKSSAATKSKTATGRVTKQLTKKEQDRAKHWRFVIGSLSVLLDDEDEDGGFEDVINDLKAAEKKLWDMSADEDVPGSEEDESPRKPGRKREV